MKKNDIVLNEYGTTSMRKPLACLLLVYVGSVGRPMY